MTPLFHPSMLFALGHNLARAAAVIRPLMQLYKRRCAQLVQQGVLIVARRISQHVRPITAPVASLHMGTAPRTAAR